MSAKMIDASVKRKRQLAFELWNSRVLIEKRNNQTPFGGTYCSNCMAITRAGKITSHVGQEDVTKP